MPISNCQINNEPGYKWGKSGKCYAYDPSSDSSKEDAKKKAIAQGVAIGDLEALGAQISVLRGTYKFTGEKTGMDFDDTLSTEKGQALWKRIGADYVVTARPDSHLAGVWKVTDRLGIPRSRVIATGSNEAKAKKVKELGISIFYDNNPGVIKMLPGIGKLFRP